MIHAAQPEVSDDAARPPSDCTCPRVETPAGDRILHTDYTCPMHGVLERRVATGEWRGLRYGWALSSDPEAGS